MTTVAGTRALYSAQRSFRAGFTLLMLNASERASGVLTRYAAADGTIDPQRIETLQASIGEQIQRLFVGENLRSPYRNEVEPLAPFPRLLNKWYMYTVASTVKAHRDMMLRLLKNAPDVVTWLEGGERPVEEGYNPTIDPLRSWVSMFRWNDPRGYQLSSRIWQNSVRTRAQIDAFLEDAIRNGTGSLPLSKQLEQFLVPGRAALRTKKPYGSSAAHHAMTLARTEITAAHGRATIAVSKANPFVDKIAWRTSRSHKDRDECDFNEANGPYNPDKVPTYPNHPNEMCSLVPVVTQSPQDVIAEMRADMRQGKHAPFTPLSRNFLNTMLGAYLLFEAQRLFPDLF